jgi:hypothetical protein
MRMPKRPMTTDRSTTMPRIPMPHGASHGMRQPMGPMG